MKKILRCLLLLLALGMAYLPSQAQLIYGTSPFQDSMWAIDTTNWSVSARLAPSLPGFTITGITGMAYDAIGHETYVIMKVSGVTGRVLGRMDVQTGVCTQVGNLGMNFSTLAFRSNGQLYGVTGNGQNPNPETLFSINKNTGATTLAIALGNGVDGEIITYNWDDDMFYHWSGNGTVVMEKFPSQPPYTPVTNIPFSGSPGGETFGSIYLGSGKFINSNIASSFLRVSSTGVYGSSLINLPDDLRGLVMPPIYSIDADTVCPGDVVTVSLKNASYATDTVIYHWGDGTSSTVFPAAGATHTYSAAGNLTVHVVQKNDSVGADTLLAFPMRVLNAPVFSLNPGSDTTLCFTDSLAIVGTTGGTLQWYMNGAPITGANGGSITVNSDGWYNQVKTNQNGCEDSASVGIRVLFGDQPTANLGADTTLCQGDSICFALSNPGNVSYSWSNGSTASIECFNTGGTIGVTVTDPVGCTESDDIVVTFIAPPTTMMVIDTTNCPTILFNSNGSGADTYDWDFGDTGTGTGSSTSHTYTANGTYTYTLNATNQCFTTTQTGVIDITCVVAEDPALHNSVRILPNPNHGRFTLLAELPQLGDLSYRITDLSGRLVADEVRSDLRQTWVEQVNLDLAPGTYLLTVKSGSYQGVYRLLVQ